jgi:hypothetical protein
MSLGKSMYKIIKNIKDLIRIFLIPTCASLFIISACSTYPTISDKLSEPQKKPDEVWYSCQSNDDIKIISDKFHTTSNDILVRNEMQSLPKNKNIVGLQLLLPDIRSPIDTDVVFHWNKSESRWVATGKNENANNSNWRSVYVFVIIKNNCPVYSFFPCEANMEIPVKLIFTYDTIYNLVGAISSTFPKGVTVTAVIKPDSPIDGFLLRKLNKDEMQVLKRDLSFRHLIYED